MELNQLPASHYILADLASNFTLFPTTVLFKLPLTQSLCFSPSFTNHSLSSSFLSYLTHNHTLTPPHCISISHLISISSSILASPNQLCLLSAAFTLFSLPSPFLSSPQENQSSSLYITLPYSLSTYPNTFIMTIVSPFFPITSIAFSIFPHLTSSSVSPLTLP